MRADHAAAFTDIVWSLAARLGKRDVPAIADALLREHCPRTAKVAQEDGVEAYLRDGICRGVSEILKTNMASAQADFAEIEATFGRDKVELVKKLSAESHYVPSLGALVPIRDLMNDRALFDEARKFKRRKGNETIAQADAMDELYDALWPDA